ncbi:MAG: Lrp/AsnC family transcriptional regulator [Chloroflexi bacterium]|nr:Lrp/AsnC family transcriptional regulator [Chloroflexota bacterium]
MIILDSLDRKLIQLLQEDARKSSEALAKQLGVSAATVRRRTRKLLRNDVLRVSAIVNPDKVGLHLTALMAFNVAHDALDDVIKMLAKRPEVKWVATATGRFDILAVVQFHSTDGLSAFVEKDLMKVEGIRDSETFICLHVEKGLFA